MQSRRLVRDAQKVADSVAVRAHSYLVAGDRQSFDQLAEIAKFEDEELSSLLDSCLIRGWFDEALQLCAQYHLDGRYLEISLYTLHDPQRALKYATNFMDEGHRPLDHMLLLGPIGEQLARQTPSQFIDLIVSLERKQSSIPSCVTNGLKVCPTRWCSLFQRPDEQALLLESLWQADIKCCPHLVERLFVLYIENPPLDAHSKALALFHQKSESMRLAYIHGILVKFAIDPEMFFAVDDQRILDIRLLQSIRDANFERTQAILQMIQHSHPSLTPIFWHHVTHLFAQAKERLPLHLLDTLVMYLTTQRVLSMRELEMLFPHHPLVLNAHRDSQKQRKRYERNLAAILQQFSGKYDTQESAIQLFQELQDELL